MKHTTLARLVMAGLLLSGVAATSLLAQNGRGQCGNGYGGPPASEEERAARQEACLAQGAECQGPFATGEARGPGMGQRRGQRNGAANGSFGSSVRMQPSSTQPLDEAAKQALIQALTGPMGEFAARAEYAAILEKFGADVQPYANIMRAETRHAAALRRQLSANGLPVPVDTYLGNVTAPSTLLKAAEVGAAAEVLNVAMYDELLTKVQKFPNLVRVLTHLRAASLNHHLPAFESAIENGGSLPSGASGHPDVRGPFRRGPRR